MPTIQFSSSESPRDQPDSGRHLHCSDYTGTESRRDVAKMEKHLSGYRGHTREHWFVLHPPKNASPELECWDP